MRIEKTEPYVSLNPQSEIRIPQSHHPPATAGGTDINRSAPVETARAVVEMRVEACEMACIGVDAGFSW